MQMYGRFGQAKAGLQPTQYKLPAKAYIQWTHNNSSSKALSGRIAKRIVHMSQCIKPSTQVDQAMECTNMYIHIKHTLKLSKSSRKGELFHRNTVHGHWTKLWSIRTDIWSKTTIEMRMLFTYCPNLELPLNWSDLVCLGNIAKSPHYIVTGRTDVMCPHSKYCRGCSEIIMAHKTITLSIIFAYYWESEK